MASATRLRSSAPRPSPQTDYPLAVGAAGHTRVVTKCSDCGQRGENRWPAGRCDACWQVAIAVRNARIAAGPTALYRLFDAGGVLLYVGITLDPARRFKEHRKVQPWWSQVARREVEWLQLGGRRAEEAEWAVIAAEGPLWNGGGALEGSAGPIS